MVARGPSPSSEVGGPVQRSCPLPNMGAVVGSIPGGGGFRLFVPRREKTPKKRQNAAEKPPARPRAVFRPPHFVCARARARLGGNNRGQPDLDPVVRVTSEHHRPTQLSAGLYSPLYIQVDKGAKSFRIPYCSNRRITTQLAFSHLRRSISSLQDSWIRFLNGCPRAVCAARHSLLYYPGSERLWAKSSARFASDLRIRPRL